MKKILFFLIVISSTYSCKNKGEAGNSKSYTINGTVAGCNFGEIYLQIMNKTEATPDTIKISKGKFTYSSKSAAPEFAILLFPNVEHKIDPKNILMFFTEPGSNIQVTFDSSAKERFVITGSKTSDEFKIFKQKCLTPSEEKEKKTFENINPMSINNPTTMDSLMKLAETIQQEKKEAVVKYITENKTSIVGAAYAYLIGTQEENSKFIQLAYNMMDDNIRNSFYGIEIKKKIDAAIKTDIGAIATDFNVKDIEGKQVTLSNFYKGKKLVLIDFWASWCGPCRKENPNVVKAYSKFHSKGFDILGISLDEEKQDWIGAIKKDGLTWTQVSDLKGWESGVARLYNVTAIPTNFLIDGTGKIIATNLRGELLETKLNELLK
jgi:peroxiredoxin